MNWFSIIRWIHIISAAAWIGEVLVINVVLVPSLQSTPVEQRGGFIARVFPRVFRLASILALVALSSGLGMSYLAAGWTGLDLIIRSRWGLGILIGGILGLLLAVFHFVVESRLKPIARSLDETPDEKEVERVMRFLQIVPRVGMLVIVAAFILMMVAARG